MYYVITPRNADMQKTYILAPWCTNKLFASEKITPKTPNNAYEATKIAPVLKNHSIKSLSPDPWPAFLHLCYNVGNPGPYRPWSPRERGTTGSRTDFGTGQSGFCCPWSCRSRGHCLFNVQEKINQAGLMKNILAGDLDDSNSGPLPRPDSEWLPRPRFKYSRGNRGRRRSLLSHFDVQV